MIPSRRNVLMGAAALSAAVATPEMVRAAAALDVAMAAGAADWALATRDLEGDVPPQEMRLVRGRAPAGLAGTLFRNGPGKFRRPGGSAPRVAAPSCSRCRTAAIWAASPSPGSMAGR